MQKPNEKSQKIEKLISFLKKKPNVHVSMSYQRNEVVIVDLTRVFLDFRIIGGNSRITHMCLVLGNNAISNLSFNNIIS